jgi:hypothetical protein
MNGKKRKSVNIVYITLARGLGVDVRGHARDSAVLARGPRVPQDDAVLVPRRHRPRGQPQQRAPRRGVARRLETLLLQYQPRCLSGERTPISF